MATAHDDVVRETAQAQSYRSCGVVLANCLFGMADEAATLTEAMAIAGMLRVAECEVLPDRRDHFIDVQRRVWEPAMAAAPGQLGGLFSCENEDSRQFVVTTFWRDESSHAAYVRNRVPLLRVSADVEADIKRFADRVVRLEADWRVVSTSS